MIDLKLSKRDKKRMRGEVTAAPSYDGPEYPYGFRLNLDTDQIEKLGVSGMEGGGMVHIEATGKIVEIRTRDEGKDKKTENMEIQIQKIEVMPEKAAKKKLRDEVAKEVFDE